MGIVMPKEGIINLFPHNPVHSAARQSGLTYNISYPYTAIIQQHAHFSVFILFGRSAAGTIANFSRCQNFMRMLADKIKFQLR